MVLSKQPLILDLIFSEYSFIINNFLENLLKTLKVWLNKYWHIFCNIIIDLQAFNCSRVRSRYA